MNGDTAIDIDPSSPSQQQQNSRSSTLTQRRRVTTSTDEKKKISRSNRKDGKLKRRKRPSAEPAAHLICSIRDVMLLMSVYTLLLLAGFKTYLSMTSLEDSGVTSNTPLLRPPSKDKSAAGEVKHSPQIIDTNINTDEETDEPYWANPRFWIEDEEDDWFERIYITKKEREKNYHALRTLNVKGNFNSVCGHYRFDISGMPDATVIITVQNEETGMLSMTVHSVLARTPPELLREIIIVDDSGSDHTLDNANEEEIGELLQLSPKVKVIHNEERIGCGKSRMVGANSAEGEVLIFVDSHIEMESGTWLQHLLLPILENPRTVSTQTIDILSDIGGEHEYKGAANMLWGIVNNEFLFTYQAERFADSAASKEMPSHREPFETPFAPGSLFAVRREFFLHVGGYDRGLYVWGGENTELALKSWTCGGRMITVPCSRVGHMYRVHMKETKRWPPVITAETMKNAGFEEDYKHKYKIKGIMTDDFGKIVKLNNLRVLYLWANDETRRNYQKLMFGSEELPPDWQELIEKVMAEPAAVEQMQRKKENQCQSFDWFDKHVYMRLTGNHHPLHSSLMKK